MEFEFIVELIVLGAIAIELYALYNHSKLDHRIDEHILDTDRNLEKYDAMIQMLNNHMSKLDERLIRLDEHMNKVDEHMTQYNEHMNKIDEHMTQYDKQLDEYISGLDNFLRRANISRTETINHN